MSTLPSSPRSTHRDLLHKHQSLLKAQNWSNVPRRVNITDLLALFACVAIMIAVSVTDLGQHTPDIGQIVQLSGLAAEQLPTATCPFPHCQLAKPAEDSTFTWHWKRSSDMLNDDSVRLANFSTVVSPSSEVAKEELQVVDDGADGTPSDTELQDDDVGEDSEAALPPSSQQVELPVDHTSGISTTSSESPAHGDAPALPQDWVHVIEDQQQLDTHDHDHHAGSHQERGWDGATLLQESGQGIPDEHPDDGASRLPSDPWTNDVATQEAEVVVGEEAAAPDTQQQREPAAAGEQQQQHAPDISFWYNAEQQERQDEGQQAGVPVPVPQQEQEWQEGIGAAHQQLADMDQAAAAAAREYPADSAAPTPREGGEAHDVEQDLQDAVPPAVAEDAVTQAEEAWAEQVHGEQDTQSQQPADESAPKHVLHDQEHGTSDMPLAQSDHGEAAGEIKVPEQMAGSGEDHAAPAGDVLLEEVTHVGGPYSGAQQPFADADDQTVYDRMTPSDDGTPPHIQLSGDGDAPADVRAFDIDRHGHSDGSIPSDEVMEVEKVDPAEATIEYFDFMKQAVQQQQEQQQHQNEAWLLAQQQQQQQQQQHQERVHEDVAGTAQIDTIELPLGPHKLGDSSLTDRAPARTTTPATDDGKRKPSEVTVTWSSEDESSLRKDRQSAEPAQAPTTTPVQSPAPRQELLGPPGLSQLALAAVAAAGTLGLLLAVLVRMLGAEPARSEERQPTEPESPHASGAARDPVHTRDADGDAAACQRGASVNNGAEPSQVGRSGSPTASQVAAALMSTVRRSARLARQDLDFNGLILRLPGTPSYVPPRPEREPSAGAGTSAGDAGAGSSAQAGAAPAAHTSSRRTRAAATTTTPAGPTRNLRSRSKGTSNK